MKVRAGGVVQLFNAVSKAQRTQKEALQSGAKQKVRVTGYKATKYSLIS